MGRRACENGELSHVHVRASGGDDGEAHRGGDPCSRCRTSRKTTSRKIQTSHSLHGASEGGDLRRREEAGAGREGGDARRGEEEERRGRA